MAHDVWLLRSILTTCLILGTFAGTAEPTNGNNIAPHVQNIILRDDTVEAGDRTKPVIHIAHKASATARVQVRSESMWLTDSFGRLETKRSIKKDIEETGARNTRMHILDKYFVHPEVRKETTSDRNGLGKDMDSLALPLEVPKPDGERKNNKLREETQNVEKYDADSMEGTKIVSAASLLENSVRSHGARVAKLMKYREQDIANTPASYRHYFSTQIANVFRKAKLKDRFRYRFVNSLLRPQLAGISDDLNDLDALRKRTKSINLKTLKNDFRSRKLDSGDRASEGSASIEENTLKHAKQQASTDEEKTIGREYNTNQEIEPQNNDDDMFLLGTPEKSSYFENTFMANPERIHEKPGLAIRPTLRRQNYRATTALTEQEISNLVHGKFGADSDTTESGLEGFVHPENESDSEESGLEPDERINTALTLATQTETETSKATPRPSLLTFKDKAMSHIEEQSNDMYNERKEDSDGRFSNGNDLVEEQKMNTSLYFSPTKMRYAPKPTTLSNYRRTTIAHRKFSSQSGYQSTSSGSGEGTGSGEYFVSSHESHAKQKHAQRITKVSFATKNKTHAGIFGGQDKETVKKCERMGKADYRDKCPPGWLPFDEFCYLFVSKSSGKWEEFPQRCNEENGLLAMPKTDKELKFLQDKIAFSKQRRKYFYIGLKKKSGNWTWIDDVPYTRDIHVNDDLSDRNCAALSKTGIHMVTCSEPKTGYICELRTGVGVIQILAFGDSLTNGFHSDDKSHTPYAKTLEYLLDKDTHRCYVLTTLAKDGTEAAGMSTRLENHLKDAKFKYSWVIILAGTNDIAHNSLNRNRKAWDTAVEHIINLHITSHRHGAKTVAVTIPEMDCEESKRPPCLHTHMEREYINEKLRRYARSNEFTILCDLAEKFPRYSLSSEERKLLWEVGLHMKPAGYERMAEIIYKDLLAHV